MATAGAAVAVSRLGSALAIAMIVGGSGTPPLAACLGPDWMRTAGWTPSHSVRGNISGRRVRGACAEALRYDTGPGCLCVIRQLTKVGRGRRERHSVPERACQWDGRISS